MCNDQERVNRCTPNGQEYQELFHGQVSDPAPVCYLGSNTLEFNQTFAEISPYLGLGHRANVAAVKRRSLAANRCIGRSRQSTTGPS